MATMDDEGLTTVGHGFGEMVGGGADRDPVQGQAPPQFDSEHKTSEVVDVNIYCTKVGTAGNDKPQSS
ncbi:unnamed protein product [Cylicostephanus goldi]|uniref:Uncharacterized protein n=1 Tax=Cylicostephanus goldi TaxID=71465 RepID=A0A3P7N281_CYLGO|nr:unnamed protein product [Cylicostephanus goldi]